MRKIFKIQIKAMIFNLDRFLVIKPFKSWEFPEGKVRFGETLERATFNRIKDLTGLDIEVLKPLYTTTIIKNNKKQILEITLLCFSKENIVKLKDKSWEYKWIKSYEFEKYLSGELINDIEMNLDIDKILLDMKFFYFYK
ncbi:MAG: hypothetical protein FH753_11370 [Firmicutes bacterium]|nr:hypothetical protein [Bacillota bacterium]